MKDNTNKIHTSKFMGRYGNVFRQYQTAVALQPQPKEIPSILWIGEAITYLGLDRTGITRPDKAIHRLIKKGHYIPRRSQVD